MGIVSESRRREPQCQRFSGNAGFASKMVTRRVPAAAGNPYSNAPTESLSGVPQESVPRTGCSFHIFLIGFATAHRPTAAIRAGLCPFVHLTRGHGRNEWLGRRRPRGEHSQSTSPRRLRIKARRFLKSRSIVGKAQREILFSTVTIRSLWGKRREEGRKVQTPKADAVRLSVFRVLALP
jgi:hypothetical protein